MLERLAGRISGLAPRLRVGLLAYLAVFAAYLAWALSNSGYAPVFLRNAAVYPLPLFLAGVWCFTLHYLFAPQSGPFCARRIEAKQSRAATFYRGYVAVCFVFSGLALAFIVPWWYVSWHAS